jgi:acyl-CoA synthetase (AMP-forming)/AMP-acid ligase II
MITPTGTLHDLANDVVWDASTLTAEAHRRAGVLHSHGLSGENGIFVITHANTASFFADLFAVWSIGGCAACVNSGLTADELERVVTFVDARAVLKSTQGNEQAAVPVLALETETTGELAPKRADADAPALILFTSGTTGAPKGVVQTYGSIAARLELNAQHIGVETMARTLTTLPTHFGHGLIGNCLTPLCNGGDVFIGAGNGLDLAMKLAQIIDTHRISFLSSVPAFWKLATRMSARPTDDSLKRIHIGSAQLSTELWQSVIDWSRGAEVVNMYGTTETANWIGGASSRDHAPEDGLLGKLWGGDVGVMNDAGQLTQTGIGEIAVRTPSVMSGYHLREDLTAEVLKDGWYMTGDVGSLDDQGVLRLTGRARYMINTAGIKVYPEELDLLFERHPEVIEVCAFSIEDVVSGEVVGLAVTLAEAATVTSKDLLQWASERIRPEALPKKVFIVDDIPKSPRGKVNRSDVAAFCLGEIT